MSDTSRMSAAKQAYEARRAAKAGKSLDTWLNDKQRRQVEATKSALPPPPPKKPGFITRLLDKAHKPL